MVSIFHNAAMIEETTAAAASLKNEAQAMATLMSQFHIGDGADVGSGRRASPRKRARAA